VGGVGGAIGFVLAVRRGFPGEMRQAGRVVGEERLLVFRAARDEVEIYLEVHIRAIAVMDLIGNDAAVAHEVGVPEAGGFSALFIKDAPGLIVVEAELPDGIVLVLQGDMPLADDLGGVAVLLELAGEAGL